MVTIERVLRDRYLLEEEIARGGMGAVFVATDRRLDRRVAVKLLASQLAGDPDLVERFKREARAAGSLGHPNIANVFDYGQDGRDHFIVMELAEGRDLARVLREEGPLNTSRAAALGAQLCAALDHAHSAGIVHRDVKPSNLIIGSDERVKVTDFGIARAAGDARLTVSGQVMGSAHYISPEVARGSEATPASDIYGAGIVLYEMVTGAVPFTGASPTAVAIRHTNEEVPPPSRLKPDVPAAFDLVVATATARDPRDRFRSAEEMQLALGAIVTSDLPDVTSTGVIGSGDAGTTGVIEQETPQTVWPIPGDRWDPHRLGRWVVVFFAILAVVALALLIARVTAGEDTAPSDRQQIEQRGEPARPSSFRMPEDIRGSNYVDVLNVLERGGYEVVVVRVASDMEEGAIVTTLPAPGTRVDRDDTITLYVSTGDEDEEEKEEKAKEEAGKSGQVPPGKGKDEEKD